MAVYSESLSNLNTVTTDYTNGKLFFSFSFSSFFGHIDTTDYTNVKLFFFVCSNLSLTTLCLTSSISHLCASELHFLSVSQVCAIPLHSYSNAVCQGNGLPGGESVHQWLCAGVERLESQALPAELQKGTGTLHRVAEPAVKPMSFRFCSAEERVIISCTTIGFISLFLVFFNSKCQSR